MPATTAPQHAPPAIRRTPVGNKLLDSSAGVVIKIAVVVALVFVVVATVIGIIESLGSGDGLATSPATTLPTSASKVPDITSRVADPSPLSEHELFPDSTVSVAGGGKYKVLKTQGLSNCGGVSDAQTAKALAAAGCSQIVRGTLESANSRFLATAGIANLLDQTKAEQADEAITKNKNWEFLGLTAGKGTSAIASGYSWVDFNVDGHYIAYCRVVRADGGKTTENEAKPILRDLITGYLENTVIQART